MTTPSDKAGRPRSEEAHKAVIATTAELLETLDYPAISVDRIVAESGVSKRTIYRWWNNKAAIILEVIAAEDIKEPDTGALETDLVQLLTGIFARVTSSRKAQAIKGLLMDAQYDAEFAPDFRAYITKRRQVCLNILERAQKRGELKKNAPLELIADLIYGPYWYRLLVGHAPLDEEFARAQVKLVLSSVA
jgi:AcrR family transcriptional regulator